MYEFLINNYEFALIAVLWSIGVVFLVHFKEKFKSNEDILMEGLLEINNLENLSSDTVKPIVKKILKRSSYIESEGFHNES